MTSLDDVVDRAVADGGRLRSRTSDEAVVVYGAGNVLMHITFAALTLAVSAYFVFPWIVWANTVREHRVIFRVVADGRISKSGGRQAR